MTTPTSKKRPTEPAASSTHRTILVNPLSKGGIGKTTFYEYFSAALDRNGIEWEGANLDDRHRAFQERHPTRVKNFRAEGQSAVDEYLPVFTAARRSAAPVYLIDQRAQADRNFVDACEKTGFVRQAILDGVQIVAVCIALDDYDYLLNLQRFSE